MLLHADYRGRITVMAEGFYLITLLILECDSTECLLLIAVKLLWSNVETQRRRENIRAKKEASKFKRA